MPSPLTLIGASRAAPIVARDFAESPTTPTPQADELDGGEHAEKLVRSAGGGVPLDRNRSISFHAPQPSWVGRRKMQRSRTMDSIDSTVSDSDSISTTSEDGRYRPKFTPGHLLSRLRRRQQEDGVDITAGVDSEAAILDSTPPPAVLQSYRRTPILSGCLAPFSIMLEVPGLTTKWYVRKGPFGEAIEYRRNPPILEAGLAISIISAVAANVCLILRFTSILRPRKGTALAIGGFVLHDAINIAALVAFGVIHAVDDGFSYSQAYWMTLASTAASLACTFTLLVDYAGTKDFKDAGSGLTQKQTQLVIVIMILLVYLSLGSLLYSLLLSIPFEAALYFTCTTTLAVGFGDIVPTTVAAKICLFFYAPLGITLFAVTIFIARGTILEEFENSYRRRREEFGRRLKERRRGLREIRRERRRAARERNAANKAGTEKGGETGRDTPVRRGSILPWRRSTTPTPTATADEGYGLPRSASPMSAMESPTRLNHHRDTSDGKAIPTSPTDADVDAPATPTTPSPEDGEGDPVNVALAAHKHQLEAGWQQFRHDLATRERTEFWTKLAVAWFLFVAFWLIGTVVFHFTEGWTLFEAFYFCFVLFSTIGFGDFTPKSDGGRSFFIIWSLMGVGVLTVLISVFSDAWGSLVSENLGRARQRVREKGRRLREKVRGRRGRSRSGDRQEHMEGRMDGEAGNSTAMSDTDEGGDNSDIPATPIITASPLARTITPTSSIGAAPSSGGILQSPSKSLPQNLPDIIEGAPLQSSPAPASASGLEATPEEPAHTQDEAASARRLAETALRLHSAAVDHVQAHRDETLGALRTVPGFREALPRHLFADAHHDEKGEKVFPRRRHRHRHALGLSRCQESDDDDEDEEEERTPHDDTSASSSALDLAPLRSLVSYLDPAARQSELDRHRNRDPHEDTEAAFKHTSRLLTFLELEQATRDVLRDVHGLAGRMRELRGENERLKLAQIGDGDGDK